MTVVLVIALSGKPAPAPVEPERKEPTAAEKAKAAARQAALEETRAKEAKEAESSARSAVELEILEKPVLEMIEWGNFKGAAGGMKGLPKAPRSACGPFSAAVEGQVRRHAARCRAGVRGKADGRPPAAIVDWPSSSASGRRGCRHAPGRHGSARQQAHPLVAIEARSHPDDPPRPGPQRSLWIRPRKRRPRRPPRCPARRKSPARARPWRRGPRARARISPAR